MGTLPGRTGGGPIQGELAAAGLPPLPRMAWLEVDCSALVANARRLRRALDEGTQLGIVVKADGYGHGLVAAARSALAGGADLLIVATADEGLALRAAGIGGRILVLYALPAERLAEAVAESLEVPALDEGSLAAIVGFAGGHGAAATAPRDELRVHLAIDTGMTRGGFAAADAAAAAEAIAATPGLRLAGTWSHLAAPEDAASVAAQRRRFDEALQHIGTQGFSPGQRHLAATGGLLGHAGLGYDLVRVGLAFYGHVPKGLPLGRRGRAVARDLRPAIRLLAHPVSTQDVPAGTRVGYGGEWRATRRSVVVTLPVGYADGWTRSSAPGAWAVVRGTRAPLVGRVSSDALAVDATDAAPIAPHDTFVLLGDGSAGEPTVAGLAELRRTIAWEVLDGLGPRLPRVYRVDGVIVGARYLDGAVTWTTDPAVLAAQDSAVTRV